MKEVIRVNGHNVLIKQQMPDKDGSGDYTTSSGIVLPETAVKGGTAEKFCGIVLAVGNKVTAFNKGEKVYFTRLGFTPCYVNDVCYILLDEGCIPMKVVPTDGDYLEADEYLIPDKEESA